MCYHPIFIHTIHKFALNDKETFKNVKPNLVNFSFHRPNTVFVIKLALCRNMTARYHHRILS